jgi:subtilisin family serine protease
VLKIRAPQAWAFSEAQGRSSRGDRIVIAQPDTGVIPHRHLDVTRRRPSFDFIDGDTDPTDSLDHRGNPGHGTGTGSVAVSGELEQMWGAAPRALHMPIRAVESVIRVSQVTVTQAIDFAVDNGAHVITMSLGGIPSAALHRAVRRAVGADIIVLAAAGNCVRTVVWPARYDECIAVGGIGHADLPWRGSCRGSAVDVSAPAENVFRARPDTNVANGESTKVAQGEGTSFAVALTAGAAALWLAHHGRANLIIEARRRGETLQQMFKRLVMATARRTPNWDSSNFGAGIVDAEALLHADLDLARGREGTLARSDDRALSIRTLIAEQVAVAAVDRELDYDRYGPELAFLLLDESAHPRRATVGRETAAGSRSTVSDELRNALSNPRLRVHLEAAH